MTRPRSGGGRPAAVLALAAVLVAGGAPAASSAETEASSGVRTTLMVFLSYEGNRTPSTSATELRRTAAAIVAEALEAKGRVVATYPGIEPVMREQRIRSGRSLDAAAFAALAAATEAERVMVANLVVYADRLVAVAREIDAADGRLLHAAVAEEPVGRMWEEPESMLPGWREAVTAAAGRIAVRAGEPAAEGRILAVLPMAPVGVDPGHAEVALHCLLRSLLRTGRCRLPDPALVRSALYADGYAPGTLEPGARRLLAERFGAEEILVPRMVSFGERSRANGPLLDEDDYAARDVTLEPEARRPLYLSLLAVDCGTGRVVSARDEYLEAEDPLGLFGIVRTIEVAARLARGADRLASILDGIEGDS